MDIRNKWISAQSMALVVLIGVSTSMSAHADQSAGDQETQHPRFTTRCKALDMAAVPGKWADFERAIVDWIATCVTSRSRNARREVLLVRASKTLAPLWRSLPTGKPARIVPAYTWGTFRVERIEFTSPQARSAGPPSPRPSPGTTPGGVPRPPTAYGQRGRFPTPIPDQQKPQVPPPPTIKPPPTLPDIDLKVPDEGEDVLFDARRLVEKLRADGRHDDADQLELKIKTAKAVLLSLAGLAGAYYVGTKVRAGKLLLMWGWNATGERFSRVGARVERLLPEVESALRDVISTAKPDIPTAGSGIDWKVLDQIVDPTMPAQLDDWACGPACVQTLLRDRGIRVSQDELIRRARELIHAGLKSKRVSCWEVGRVLQALDPEGNWRIEQPLTDEFLRGKSAKTIIEQLSAKGPWIAQVATHFVVVDGFDEAGHLRIRDPWYEPAKQRGISAGSSYRVSLRTFVDHWFANAVYRK